MVCLVLRSHCRLIHGTDKVFGCPVCPASFVATAYLDAHLRTVELVSRRKVCRPCRVRFEEDREAEDHAIWKHHVGEKRREARGLELCGLRKGWEEEEEQVEYGKWVTTVLPAKLEEEERPAKKMWKKRRKEELIGGSETGRKSRRVGGRRQDAEGQVL